MNITFTKHALAKFDVLARHNFPVNKDDVIGAVEQPNLIDESRLPLLIAQKSIDAEHVLRVVYKQEENIRVIITFYPGRKSQYESR